MRSLIDKIFNIHPSDPDLYFTRPDLIHMTMVCSRCGKVRETLYGLSPFEAMLRKKEKMICRYCGGTTRWVDISPFRKQ
uniref:Uncharacterized protein n=1 Tax=Candidatus Kentrum sp. MB TaxID=2138164 RepID=A0A450XTQ6_9GAMM|nr:MAG: hypothetical protein BECKMB1821G_GA0114241_11197 [Candidatus Kentron sp. MB]VFK35356.1 MAG: hypothetical protein BECKMB1821I_GA0114274_111310 [Candidatus Kentron sp. MB]VFK77242.1 MAG: hypothetical protein BECKMB1821H_GA0114242_111310 [Candidatus Kentron sp. MB]